MSYILDALKKADQERTLGDVPDLEATHWGERRRKRSYRWVWVVAALLLVNGVLVYLLLGSDDTGTADVASLSESRDAVPVTPVTPVPRIETAAVPLSREIAYPREPVYVPPVAPVRRPAPVPSPVPSRAQQMPSAPSAVVEAPPVYAPPPEPQPAAVSDVPEWNDLSLEFRSGLTLPHIDVHVYSDDPGRRFILVDLQKYREGETLGNGAVLEEILPGGIQLYYQGTRFRVVE